ncbi:MAG: MFS transporter [Proteobacteria bacterium]|jgi:MFS family permease|nr:MFS transporter [Pseudomonadota bacterium]MDA0971332.1 MFS transporter [Pseudomonadota bacterium]MDA0995658.1 MFS transporter [Pseudomonadota bacterium]
MIKFVFFLFLDVVAFSGVLIATLPFLIHSYGGDIFIITLAFGSFSFFQFFVSPFWGGLSDKLGRKPLLIMNCIAELVANIILALSGSLMVIFISRVIAGLFKTNVSVGTAYIADITNDKNRAKGMGMFGVAFGLGFTLGPLMGGLIAGSDFTYKSLSNVAWFACIINLINLLFVFFFLDESLKNKKDYKIKYSIDRFKSQLEVVANKSLLPFFILIFCIHLTFSGMEGTIAMWGRETFEWGPKEIGFVMLLAGLTQILVQGGLLRFLLKYYNEKQLIRSGYVSLIFGFLTIPFSNLYLMPVAIILLCYGIGVTNPCLNSLISKNSPTKIRGLAMGSAYSSQAAARFVGQPLAGLMFLHLGKNYPFYFDIVFLFVLGFFYFLNNLKQEKTL